MDHVALDRPRAGRSPPRSPGRRSSAASGAAACSSAPGSRPGTRRADRPCTACRRPPAPRAGRSPGPTARRDARAIRSNALRMQVSMPSASTSILRMPSSSMSSLSHSMKVRSSIAPLPTGTVSVSEPLGQDEAADMLRQMARHADHLLGELEHPAQMRVGEIEPGLADPLLVDLGLHAAPMGRGDRRGDVLGQAHRLADLADRRCAGGNGSPSRRSRRGRGRICVDVLDHLLAPLMLEIDVDVGRLLALLGNEALEQQVALAGSTAVMPRQ